MSNYPGQQTGYPPQGNQHQGYGYQSPQQPGFQNTQAHGASPNLQPGAYGQANSPHFGASPPIQQGAYGHPSPQSFGTSPQIQQGAYGQPSPQHFNASPQFHQGPYGQPSPQGYGQAQPVALYPPTPASPGYDPAIKTHGNAGTDADLLRKAMKGFGTDEKTLIRILSKPDPLQMTLLRETYLRNHKRDLESDVRSETSGNFRSTAVALIAGPLMQDVFNLKTAVKGVGTKEQVLNDILCGRSNADMNAIKAAYKKEFNVALDTDVGNDLSGKTAQLFRMIMSAQRTEESAPIDPKRLADDVAELHRATAGSFGDPIPACEILAYRSDGHIRALAHEFQRIYQVDLEKKLKGSQTGHIEDALVLMLNRATDRAMTDAVQIEEAMSGIGTKDELLLNRIVRVHWNRAHTDQVKRAYQFKYKQDLISRVRGETSGDYEKLLVACLE